MNLATISFSAGSVTLTASESARSDTFALAASNTLRMASVGSSSSLQKKTKRYFLARAARSMAAMALAAGAGAALVMVSPLEADAPVADFDNDPGATACSSGDGETPGRAAIAKPTAETTRIPRARPSFFTPVTPGTGHAVAQPVHGD